MYIRFLLVLVIAILVQGCASNYKSNPKHSLAWNISKASDITIKEMPQEKFENAVGKNYDGNTNALLDAGFSSGIVDYAWYSSTGILTLADIGTTFGISLLLRLNEPDDPATKDHILAWMPKSFASDEEDAVHKMMRLLVDTLKELPEPQASLIDWERTELEIKNVDQKFLASNYRFNVYFTGGECEVFDCILYMNLFEPEIVGRPDFINNEENTFFHFKPDGREIPNILVACGFPSKHRPSGKPLITDNSISISKCSTRMEKVKNMYYSLLPDWFNIYRVPQKYGNPLPNLQNRDKLMLYIKPS